MKHLYYGLRKSRNKNEKILDESMELIKDVDENKKLRDLSLGMREKVSLVTALLSSPKYILIDEAFSNINNKDLFIQNYISLSKNMILELFSYLKIWMTLNIVSVCI